jgi:hypothetical protein
MKNRFNSLPYIIFSTPTIALTQDRAERSGPEQNRWTKKHTGHFFVYLRGWMLIIIMTIALTACTERSKLPMEAGFGATPQLPPPIGH